MAAARERAALRSKSGLPSELGDATSAGNIASPVANMRKGTESYSRHILSVRDGNSAISQPNFGSESGEAKSADVGPTAAVTGRRASQINPSAVADETADFDDGDAVLDISASNIDPDPLGLDKQMIVQPSLVHSVKPTAVFAPETTCFPDGRGEARQTAAVAEVISGDFVMDGQQAFADLSAAGEAAALVRGGRADAAVLAAYPALALMDDGLVKGRAAAVGSGNLRRLAQRELREYAHAAHRQSTTAASKGGEASVISALQGANPASFAKIAALVVPEPLGDPIDAFVGRITSSAAASASSSSPAAGNNSGPAMSTVGAIRSTIGAESMVQGAVSASEYQARLELQSHAHDKGGGRRPDAPDGSAGADGAATQLPLLRIVRPLAGDATDLALANATPATLNISVGGVAFRDHPLFSREDYLVSGLKSLYSEYGRRMRSGNVAALDMRLRALLAYTMVPAVGGDGRRSGSSPAQQHAIDNEQTGSGDVIPVYDFENDGLSDLCARCGAVLEALNQRYEEVIGASDVMRRLWSTWRNLKIERESTRMTLTSARLEVREVNAGSSGNGVDASTPVAAQQYQYQQQRPPALHPILYATACLLDRLKVVIGEISAAAGYASGSDGDAAQGPSTGWPSSSTSSASDLAIAGRLWATGSTLLTQIHEGEQRFGRGYGCGGLGSGVADVSDMVMTATAHTAPSSNGAVAPTGMLALQDAGQLNQQHQQYAYPAAREFVLRLHGDEVITADALVPVQERQRRAAIRNTWVCTEVFVNGRPVAKSAPARLQYADFTAPASLSAALLLFRRPASISIRVCDCSSAFSVLIGPSTISEVLIPVPGQADLSSLSRNGNNRHNAGSGGAALDEGGLMSLPTSAIEPVIGTFEFSATQPLQRPSFVPDPMVTSSGAANAGAGVGVASLAPAVALVASGSGAPSQGLSSGFQHQRLTSGSVAVSCAWQAPEHSDTGNKGISSAVQAGVSSSSSAAAAAADGYGPSTLVAVPALDSSYLPSQQDQNGATMAALLQAVGNIGTGVVNAVTSPFSNKRRPVLPTSATTTSAAGRASTSKVASSTGAMSGMVGGYGQYSYSQQHQQQMGDTRLLRELAALPVPRAMTLGNTSGGGGGNMNGTGMMMLMDANPAMTANLGMTAGGLSNAPTTTLRLTDGNMTTNFNATTAFASSGILASTSASITANANTSSNNNANGNTAIVLTGRQGYNGQAATMRRSQAVAAAEASLQAARLGVTSIAIPVQGLDPNDPRAITALLAMRKGRGAGRSTKFRVTALPQALAFGSSPSASAGGNAAFGMGALDLVGSALNALVPLPGRQRHQLLRLRGERPDLFRDVHESVPLSDEDISKSVVLRELLRSALVSMGYSEQTADALQYGPLAYLRQGAKALGISSDGVSASGNGKTSDWTVSGAGTASAVAKARLLFKIRDFLSRVRASPTGQARFLRRVLLSEVVKELSLPALRAFINFSRILAILAPRRSLRPRAVDVGIPLDLGPMGGGISSALLGSGLRSGLSPQYRITVQVVRARNVPVRRPAYAAKGRTAGVLTPSSQQAMLAAGLQSPAPGAIATDGSQQQQPQLLQYAQQQQDAGASDTVVAVVEARFQGRAVRSSAVSGSNPQWNEILGIPFMLPNGGSDTSPARLADITDNLTLSLFDEGVLEGRVDDRDVLTTVVRRQRRWLGTISIPFVSLYAQGGLKAEMRLETPAVNLGYRTPSVVHVGSSTLQGPGGAARVGGLDAMALGAGGGGAGGGMAGAPGQGGGGHASMTLAISDPVGMTAVAESNRRATHLYVCISVDPPLPAADDDDEDGDDKDDGDGAGQMRALRGLKFDGSIEMRRILEYAAKWSDKYGSKKESSIGAGGTMKKLNRVVKAIVSNIVGEPVLVTRYLAPQAPPPDAAAAVADLLRSEVMRASQADGDEGGNGGVTMTPPRKARAGMYGDAAGVAAATLGRTTNGFITDGSGMSAKTNSHLDPLAKMPLVPALVPRMSSVDAVARFVSLVPYMADTHAFGTHSVEADLWATSQECLDMGAGDAEEHAIMLHNYLSWFEQQQQQQMLGGTAGQPSTPSATPGWRSYIVCGRAQPDGETTWVMRQDTSSPGLTTIFINASTGRSYLSTDDTCPLLSVGMVATADNVWANIQPFTEAWRMSFDLMDPRCWAPLFTPRRPHPGPVVLPSVQGIINYRAPDTRLAAALESEIGGALTAALRAWRPRYITRIRGDVSTALRPLLLELEARACGVSGTTVLPASEGLVQVSPGGVVAPVTIGPRAEIIMPGAAYGRPGTASGLNAGAAGAGAAGSLAVMGGGGTSNAVASAMRDVAGEHQAALERLVARYRPSGFPLHMTFTDLDAALQAVKATGIHRIEDEAVQYAVGVAVIPYPNDIFSVWIYPVALLPA